MEQQLDTILFEIKSIKKEIEDIKSQLNNQNNSITTLTDVIVESLVHKKEEFLFSNKASSSGSSNSQTLKNIKKVKINKLNITEYIKDLYKYLNTINYPIDEYNLIQNENCLESIKSIENTINVNAIANVKNCFGWAYSHINSVRTKTLEMPIIESFLQDLYNTDKDKINKIESITELLNYEANKIYKEFKDKPIFKLYVGELKNTISNNIQKLKSLEENTKKINLDFNLK
jgi:hypothetical protein